MLSFVGIQYIFLKDFIDKKIERRTSTYNAKFDGIVSIYDNYRTARSKFLNKKKNCCVIKYLQLNYRESWSISMHIYVHRESSTETS